MSDTYIIFLNNISLHQTNAHKHFNYLQIDIIVNEMNDNTKKKNIF